MSLAEVELDKLRQILGDDKDDEVNGIDKPSPIVQSFTTSKKRSIPMDGIVIPIYVGCRSTESSNKG